MNYLSDIQKFIESNTLLSTTFSLLLLVIAGMVTHLICKFFVVKVVRKVFFSTHKKQVPLDKDVRLSEKLSNFIPVITVYYLLQFMPDLPEHLLIAIKTICGILFFVYLSLFFTEVLEIVNNSYSRKSKRKNHSIKGYIQVGKILVHIISAIMILAIMSNKSPVIIISSLGAVAAVLMLVFQHTLMSLVANIQVSSNDVLQLGDWIEMPDKGISGEVIDIALHTITLRNWDNTLSRIPTKNFLTETYTNWQAMFSSGARRIMRSFHLDQMSIRFLDHELIQQMSQIRGVNEQLSALMDGRDSNAVGDRWFADNGMTNLTVFRKYLTAWLSQRDDIKQDMYIVVRTMKPSPEGLPVEVYCFTSSIFWVEYENSQSAIFEYIYAIVGQFGLRMYQHPGGNDFWRLSQQHASSAKSVEQQAD
ncbi:MULTISPECIES: mechanosensitive ion channel family protein [Pantoea]|jgi:miniconductance mechanosensitive channel|uniref:Mechanosensitive ion channel n=1 Tax=Candidatus Pantoea communis TaxID=2608354 RepID=A0ABX0RJ82_9GAMM|nr:MULTISPECIES: mechanosensitive ion channel domain-containing protein [Pantoea]KJV34984.1 membrane protein [Pantoea sp. SM3]MXP51745.1 mechanosensitive ion channel [Pantoea sp. Seng]MXP58920.1 mechanosensitive ion channel [Pantoea sp. Taur]NIG17686.1 mechanosensitive ion channel [Pantoea communis]